VDLESGVRSFGVHLSDAVQDVGHVARVVLPFFGKFTREAQKVPEPGVFREVSRGGVLVSSGFRVQGSEFRVQGLEFRVQGSGSRVQGSGFGM
jgi:hypothetical protein